MPHRTARLLPLIAALALPSATLAATPPPDCPLTMPPVPNVKGPFEPPTGYTWYGNDVLAVLITTNGRWVGMGPERRYRDKLWWWSDGYDFHVEGNADLVVTAKRLDAKAPPVRGLDPTVGYAEHWHGWAILTGLGFPAAGCWEVTGEYEGQRLSFVILVDADESSAADKRE